MEIIPAISILDGENVSLYKGSYEQMETYYKSPIESARHFEREGAKKLYIADLNGKQQKSFVQKEVVQKIIGAIKIPVLVESGFKTLESMEEAFQMGVYQVVLRSPDLDFLKEAIAEFGSEKMMIQLFSKRSDLIENGNEPVNPDKIMDVVDYAELLIPLGVKYVMYKDQRSEGTLIHPNYDEIDRLFLTTGNTLKIYASGGVGELKHLKMLKKIGASGAMIDKAFQEKRFSISEAEESVA